MGILFKRAFDFHIAKHALGKYIILQATLMHVAWASIILADIRAGNSTPVSILFYLFHNQLLVAGILYFVAFCALLFLNLRLRTIVGLRGLTALLIPQQAVLWCSAGAGIYATVIQRYADGVIKSWSHIACDQMPILLMAILYSIAVIETVLPPVHTE